MKQLFFIDTNIFLRAILNDHKTFTPASQKLLKQIEKNELEAITTDMIIAEIVFVLESYKDKKFSKEEIRTLVKPLVSIPNLHVPSKKIFSQILDIYVEKNIDFIDAYNMMMMKQSGVKKAYSYGTHFTKTGILDCITP